MTDSAPQSSTPSEAHSPSGLNAEIGKAFKEVEAAENKAISIEKRIKAILGVSENLLQKRKKGLTFNGQSMGMTLA